MSPDKDPVDSKITEEKPVEFIEYIEALDPDILSEMLASRVIPSFFLSVKKHGIDLFSEKVLKLWIVDMLLDGYKGSTVKRYVGAMHTLYKKWLDASGFVDDDFAFSVSLNGIDSEATARRLKEVEDNLPAMERFTQRSLKHESQAFVYGNAFQYLLFDPLVSLKGIVTMKFSDPRPDSVHLDDIVTSMRKAPQAKYVFPLQQGKRRDGAIIKDLLSELHATGRRAGLKFSESFSRESITSLWIAAAIRENIPYSEIRGILPGLPTVYSFLSLIAPEEVSEARKTEILNIVAYSITNKNPGWLVLRLRSGVTPEKIRERLKEKESPLQRQIQYYYPLRTVKKIERKKVVSESVPVIPGLLFFRLPYDRVASLVSVIGDLAWCYRTSPNPSSPYSVIPQAEMRVFQRCVGMFTEDVEMDIVSELPSMNIGDEVMIEDGSMLDGQVATIRKVRNVDGTLTYTLRLSDTAYIKFKDVSLPASHLSKVDN